MFKIVVLNLGFFICAAIPFLPVIAEKLFTSNIYGVIVSSFGILVCSVYLSAAAFSIRAISDYGAFSFGDFFKSFKVSWLPGLVMGGFVIFTIIVLPTVLRFYGNFNPPILGITVLAFVFWTTVFVLLSFQYYFSVYARLGSSIKKSFKKCILISMDNTGFSVFLFLSNILMLSLSLLIIFILFPGPVGVLLYIDEALRLRILKYDWLEANPDANRRKVPWDALLIEEREKTGTRSIKNFIFPWKY